MQYFNSLPKIRYVDQNNVTTVYTNLMARASVIPSVLNNALVYYSYDVQDGDTPEIIAYKYYEDFAMEAPMMMEATAARENVAEDMSYGSESDEVADEDGQAPDGPPPGYVNLDGTVIESKDA